MKELIINERISVDAQRHTMEVPEEYVEKTNPIYASYADDINLRLHTEKGVDVTLNVGGYDSLDPMVQISIEFPNKGKRSYYFSERSYVESGNNHKYWSQRYYQETDGLQGKFLGVHYQREDKRNTGVQKIWSRYKEQLDGGFWPLGHVQNIPAEKIEECEAALTQLPRVKEVLEFVKTEFENVMPGLTEFLLFDKRFDGIRSLLGKEISKEVETNMSNMLYIDSKTDMELCNLSNTPSYDGEGPGLL